MRTSVVAAFPPSIGALGRSLVGRFSPYTALPGCNPIANINGRFLPDTGPIRLIQNMISLTGRRRHNGDL